MENQEKLKDNRTDTTTPAGHRAALIGAALLQGVLLCGRCGARMHVQYVGHSRRIVYLCRSPGQSGTGTGICWMVPGAAIDEQVAMAFLAAARPPELELAFAVTREAERQAAEIDQQWKLRLERSRYETRHAERRYKAVDPDNRVVARTLEAQWEAQLREVEQVEREYERARELRKVTLSEEDRRRILELASDLPRVWRANTTTQQQRKNLLRILIREVTLTPIDVPVRSTRAQVLWESGSVSEYFIERQRFVSGRQAATKVDEAICRLVARGKYDDQIAEILNGDGLKTGLGRAWDIHSVRRARARLGVNRPSATPALTPAPDRRADGLCSIRAVTARLGVTEATVRHWVRTGRLGIADGGGRGRPAWFNLDDDTVARLMALPRRTSNNEDQGAS